MPATEKDKRILVQILRYCEKIDATVNRFGKDFHAFADDADYLDSVSMNILQIGEFAGRLSDEFVSETILQINWRAVKNMRNLFAHNYNSVDVDVVWESVLHDIPVLEEFCKSQLE